MPVDDTRLARQELKTLLASHADIELVGEAEDLPAARDAAQRLQPDLLLLDIQLPSGTGFDLRAFESNALDYLIKREVVGFAIG